MAKKVDTLVFGYDIEIDDYEDRYGVNIYCYNCGKHDCVWIKKGTLKKGLSIKCNQCDCKVKL